MMLMLMIWACGWSALGQRKCHLVTFPRTMENAMCKELKGRVFEPRGEQPAQRKRIVTEFSEPDQKCGPGRRRGSVECATQGGVKG